MARKVFLHSVVTKYRIKKLCGLAQTNIAIEIRSKQEINKTTLSVVTNLKIKLNIYVNKIIC